MSTLLTTITFAEMGFAKCFEAIIGLLAGLGALLIGFKLLSDNMEKVASGGLKKMFSSVSKSKLAGVGIGAGATAIVQSSGATTVMIVGFVNVGIMSLQQATAMIMGANIGTTITAHIATLSFLDFGISFDIMQIATALSVVGIFMNMLAKKDVVKTVGLILGGLGLVFIGLEGMAGSMSTFSTLQEVKDFIASVNNPFLLLLIGIVSTALIQSSSATTSIVITMTAEGLIIGTNSTSVLYFILGTNIGSCVTAMMSVIGANRNAIRAGLIHLMFNLFGSILFFTFLAVWDLVAPLCGGTNFMDMTIGLLFTKPEQQIAMFHTFFNVICTAIFLPFTDVFVKLSGLIVPEKKGQESNLSLIDERMLKTPAVAIEQLYKESIRLADMCMNNLKLAFGGYIKRDEGVADEVAKNNEEITVISKAITDYLIKVSSNDISMKDESIISNLHHNMGDIVRIAEMADNFVKYTRREIKHNLIFSSGVNEQVEEMFKKLEELFEATKKTMENNDISMLKEVDALEEQVDGMRKQLINDHIDRLNNGYCKPENSSVFINLVSNLERVGDHLAYLAHSIEEVKTA